MKRSIFNILTASAILTTTGFLMDGDAKEPSVLMRFAEFIGMIAMISIVTMSLYFPSRFVLKTIRNR